MLTPRAEQPENDRAKLIEALEYLRDAGMSVEYLRDIHQSDYRRETYKLAIDYRAVEGPVTYRGENLRYHRRLLFLAAEHWRTCRSFEDLVEEAKKIP
ncbi:MAG: hypothetical protein FJX25_10205 [Alphaproteobacteria bacterium]|nr:hypothetical protein [Alphaproteobacteria bacterium]